jgi:hypothetical protein
MLRSVAAAVMLEVIPVMIGATGTMSKSFRRYQNNTPGKHDTTELQKTVTLSAAHKLREVLTWKCKTFSVGNGITCSTNCDYSVAATLCTVETWFVWIHNCKTLHTTE